MLARMVGREGPALRGLGRVRAKAGRREMTALVDIGRALVAKGPVTRGHRRFVIIGRECMKALAASSHERVEPTSVDGVPLLITDEFPGWTVVDRPIPTRTGKSHA